MKRYKIDIYTSGFGDSFIDETEHDLGEWVRWEDVKEIVEEYYKIINEEQNDINYL